MNFSLGQLLAVTTTLAVLVWFNMETGFPNWPMAWQVMTTPTLTELETLENATKKQHNINTAELLTMFAFGGLWFVSIVALPLYAVFATLLGTGCKSHLAKILVTLSGIITLTYVLNQWGFPVWVSGVRTAALNDFHTYVVPAFLFSWRYIAALVLLFLVWRPHLKATQ